MINTDGSFDSNFNLTQKVNWSKFDQFNLMYWNINSLRNKLFDIEESVYQNSRKIVHFIALTETRIFDNETEFFNISNYNAYFSNRNDGHGGAALYVHSSLDSNLIASGVEFKINYVIVNIPSIKTSIAVIYKKPTVSFDKFQTVLSKVLSLSNKIILIGDMNPNIQLDNNTIRQYISTLNSTGHCLLNNRDKKFATRINKRINARITNSSTIDHVISNNTNFKFNLGLNDLDISDHKSIFPSFRDTTNKIVNFVTTEQNLQIKKLDINKFKTMLSRELSIFEPTDSTTLFRTIENVKNRCVSVRQVKKNLNPHKRWVNNELIDLIRERNRYNKLTKKFPSNEYAKSKHCELSR